MKNTTLDDSLTSEVMSSRSWIRLRGDLQSTAGRDVHSFTRRWQLVPVTLMLSTAIGCGGSAGVSATASSDAAGARAVELFDTNGDGEIDGNESAACYALFVSFPRIDSDSDGRLRSDEVSLRVASHESAADISDLVIKVTSNRSPVANASIIAEPAPFLPAEGSSYSATTNGSGEATLRDDGAGSGAVKAGFYRLIITSPSGREIVRGFEVSDHLMQSKSISVSI